MKDDELRYFIVVGFSRPKKWKIGACAICWWMRKPYSHVYLRFQSSDPEIPSNVYHAAGNMVHFRSYENFLKDNISVKEYIIPITRELRRKLLIHCMNISGEKYGYLELIKILLNDLSHSLFNRELKFKDSNGYICSELVATLISSLDITFDKPSNLIKPNDIEFKLSELGYKALL